MALRNPTINPPLLPRPQDAISPHTSPPGSPVSPLPRSSSVSPVQSHRLRSISQDPILRDLSPTKTLRALSFTSRTDTEAGLIKSVENVTEDDRAFGVRVAQTCKDLRAWAVEVEAWEWPGTFEPPQPWERSSKRRRMLAHHEVPESHLAEDSDDDEDDGFWGSLPRELVLSYEARIDAIHQAMEAMDVEGLKSHVRNVHILPKAMSPKPDEYTSFKVRSVDDYTTLVTATILQALPYLSWLTRLLNEWSLRLLVLRKVPGFLSGMEETRSQLDHAWRELDQQSTATNSTSPVRDKFQSMQTVLGSKISALAQRLDSMLDELEGRPETLPDSWIDSFEALEVAYSHWVVKAEPRVSVSAWDFDLPPTPAAMPGCEVPDIMSDQPQSGGNALGTTQPDHNTIDAYELDAAPAATVCTARDTTKDARVLESPSPTLGERAVHRFESATTLQEPSIRLGQDSEMGRLVDDVILESQDLATSPNIDDNGPAPMSPSLTAQSPDTSAQAPVSQPPSPSKSPRGRARHIPIDVQAYKDAAVKALIAPRDPDQEPTSLETEPSSLPGPPHPDLVPASSAASIAARKAMFNGNLEDKQILLKASSPVRPFEHASNAFTKLFKPGAGHVHSRTGSNASKSTLKKKNMTPSLKSRRSVDSMRTSGQSFDMERTRGRIRRALEGGVVDIPLKPEENVDRSRARTQSAHQNPDWSDKEVVVSGPMSEHSPALSQAKFDSPLSKDRLSGAWPLPKIVDEEISSPGGAIRSDAFEQMFINTLPTSPIIYDETYQSNLAAFEDYIERLRQGTMMQDNIEPNDLADGIYKHTMDDAKTQTARSKPAARRDRRHQHYDTSSSSHDSVSILRSQASTPEIRDASSAGFFKPQEVTTARKPRTKRRSKRDKHGVKSPIRPRQSSGVSAPTRVFIDGDNDADQSGSEEESLRYHSTASRRSTVGRSSIPTNLQGFKTDAERGSFQRDDNDLLESSGPVQSQTDHSDPNVRSKSKRRDRSDSDPVFPMPPSVRPSHLRSRSAKDGRAMLQALRSDSERSVIGHSLGASKPSPLALRSMPSLREPGASGEELDMVEEEARLATPRKSERRRDSVSSANGDYMDRHVSQVLRKMTSSIYFSTRPGQSDMRSRTPTQNDRRTPTQRRSSVGITLAPASPNQPILKRQVRDGDTKLYHLSQPGKEQPIKLFVRLVGSPERVMVRVGGGWMDLEDYLRQYADHHTHRTINGSSIEITEAARVASKSSSPLEANTSSRPVQPRPESALGFHVPIKATRSPDLISSSPPQHSALVASPDSHVLSEPTLSQQTTPASEADLTSPTSRLTDYFDNLSQGPSATTESPSRPELRPNPLFPRIVDPPIQSRRTSFSVDNRTSSSNSATTNTPAGSGNKEEQKRRWVEDMMRRARDGSGDKDKGKEGSWRGLSKEGGTRRVSMWESGMGRNTNKW